MKKFRERFSKFMIGRYGMDRLGQFLTVLALVFILAGFFVRSLWLDGLADVYKRQCGTGFLTSARDPGVGQCQAGSLTGAVASERVSEALKGSLRMDGNHSKSAKA